MSVDGSTGIVIWGPVPLAQASQKKEVRLFLSWLAKANGSSGAPRLAFEAVAQKQCANCLINNFYLTDAMAQASVGNVLAREAAQLRESVHKSTAETLACYLAVAAAGELRHASTDWQGCRSELEQLKKNFMLQLGGDRLVAQTETINVLAQASREEQAEFFRLAADVFEKGHWSSSFGGKKWGAIVLAPLLYLRGELNPSVFADHAFDLQHNNGSVFGKHTMLEGDRGLVHRQLESKKHAANVQTLYAGLSKLHNQFAPEVVELLQKGQALGLWVAGQNQKAA